MKVEATRSWTSTQGRGSWTSAIPILGFTFTLNVKMELLKLIEAYSKFVKVEAARSWTSTQGRGSWPSAIPILDFIFTLNVKMELLQLIEAYSKFIKVEAAKSWTSTRGRGSWPSAIPILDFIFTLDIKMTHCGKDVIFNHAKKLGVELRFRWENRDEFWWFQPKIFRFLLDICICDENMGNI